MNLIMVLIKYQTRLLFVWWLLFKNWTRNVQKFPSFKYWTWLLYVSWLFYEPHYIPDQILDQTVICMVTNIQKLDWKCTSDSIIQIPDSTVIRTRLDCYSYRDCIMNLIMYLINKFSPLNDKPPEREVSMKDRRHQPTLKRHLDGIDNDEWCQQICQRFQRKALCQVRVEGDPFKLVQGFNLAGDERGDRGEDAFDREVVLPVLARNQAMVESNQFGGCLTVDLKNETICSCIFCGFRSKQDRFETCSELPWIQS